jgi:hypothetical protein
VTLIVVPPPKPDSAVAIAVQIAVLVGYDEVRRARSLFAEVIVTWAPPPRSTFVAAHVAVDVI